MAIPTDGGGSEVLKRNSIYNQSTSATQIDWAQAVQTAAGNSSGTVAVPANVIITILTVFFTNRISDFSFNLSFRFKFDIHICAYR